MKKFLFLICGVPGSGKTTFIKEDIAKHDHGDHSIRISRDDIRFSMLGENDSYFSKENEVFDEFIHQINSALLEYEAVYADATHLTEKARNKTLDRLNLDGVNIVPIYFDIPLDICLERNSKRQGREFVPPEVIEKMYNTYTCPKDDVKHSYLFEIRVTTERVFYI